MHIKLTQEQMMEVHAEVERMYNDPSTHPQQEIELRPVATLRPGQMVADVGGGQVLNADEMPYVGPLNPDTLDRLDWAWLSQNADKVKGPSEMFDRKPWLGERATGMLYHAGDLATTDLSGYYVAGSKFAPFLKG